MTTTQELEGTITVETEKVGANPKKQQQKFPTLGDALSFVQDTLGSELPMIRLDKGTLVFDTTGSTNVILRVF